MSKLTLEEAIFNMVRHHLPFEVIPGTTTNGSIRHHVLVIAPNLPSFYMVFGDELHGSLLDSAYVTVNDGKRIRIADSDLRKLLETPYDAPRWSREMPAAFDSVPLEIDCIDPYKRLVSLSGHVTDVIVREDDSCDVVLAVGSSKTLFTVKTGLADAPAEGEFVAFNGAYEFPFNLDAS